MLDEDNGPLVRDAETEFRARVAPKVQSTAYAKPALAQKFEELLRTELKPRLNVE